MKPIKVNLTNPNYKYEIVTKTDEYRIIVEFFVYGNDNFCLMYTYAAKDDSLRVQVKKNFSGISNIEAVRSRMRWDLPIKWDHNTTNVIWGMLVLVTNPVVEME